MAWEESVPHDIAYGSASSTRDDARSVLPTPDADISTPTHPPTEDVTPAPVVPHTDEIMVDPVPYPSHIPLLSDSPHQVTTPPALVDEPLMIDHPLSPTSVLDPIPTVGTIRRSKIPVLEARPAKPSHQPYRLQPGGRVYMFTPWKRVIRRPRIYSTSAVAGTSRHRRGRMSEIRRWDWIPDALRRWRETEGTPSSTYEVGESSQTLPITGEPVEHTIPVVIARLARHDVDIQRMRQDRELGDRVRRTQHRTLTRRVGALMDGQRDTEEEFFDIYTYFNTQHDQIEELSTRMTTAEQRATAAEQRAIEAERQISEMRQ